MVCSAIDRYFKDLSRVELTRHFEELLDKIKRGELRREHVIRRTIEVVGEAIERFLKNIDSTKPGDIDLPGVKKGGCPICGGPIDPGDKHGFCHLHSLAHRRIIEKYREWSENNYSWDKYLEKIYGLKITGSKIKEVIGYIRKEDRAQDHQK
jgi:DNA topoisomerase-1